MVTCPLKLSEKFRGTGESFLFSFPAISGEEEGSSNCDQVASNTEIAVYQWTGENSYIVKGSPEGLYIGCGE